MPRSYRSAFRFRLLTERLEARDCPSVTVFQREQVLFLTGDGADDRVMVADLGGGTYEVRTSSGVENPTIEQFESVTSVFADLRGGGDTFHFLQAKRPSPQLGVVVELGAGERPHVLLRAAGFVHARTLSPGRPHLRHPRRGRQR